jgi:hypothetical protein
MNLAVKELENKLIKAKDTSYDGIDALMRTIMKKYNLTAKELHNGFVNKHNQTPDTWIKEIPVKKNMKTFREFCENANIQELFGFNVPTPPKPAPPTTVLAYKNYKPGVLDKTSNKFTPRLHTSKEQQRYGWKPVVTTSYSPGDRFTPNKVTATGDPHNWTTRNAASPFKYAKGQAPSSSVEGKPSIPYNSTLNLTSAPMGKNTKITKAKLNDVGDFGKTGGVNRDVSFDLSPRIVRDIKNDNTSPNSQISKNWGKSTVYAKITPPPTPRKNK